LVAQEALRRGHRPVLAGRKREPLEEMAEELGLAFRVFDLNDADAIASALLGQRLVLHAAGPFIHTSAPMVEACLRAGVHYVDITGEIAVFESIFARDAEAKARRVALLPGVGFDVVPSDCLANHVAARCPGATRLDLFIDAGGRTSTGTARSMVESIPGGGLVRRGGKLVPQPLGRGGRDVRFLDGERRVLPIPWGDLATAWRSTGIPDITTYMASPSGAETLLRLVGPALQKALSFKGIRDAVSHIAGEMAQPPDAATRRTADAHFYARAVDASGHAAEAWLETPEAYHLTALTGVRSVERILAEEPTGALTPAMAFGADFILEIPGVRRFDGLPAGPALP
jgi:short subunit dehydrogenase-like uncharacterized protein